MLGRGKKNLKNTFDKLLEALNNYNEAQYLATANTFTTLWKLLLENFGDVDTFINSSESERVAFMGRLDDFRDKMAENEKNGEAPSGSTLRAFLSYVYIGAIAVREKPKLINYMAEALEPLNRLGW